MAILKVVGAAFMAALLSMVSTLNGIEWGDLSPTSKFVAIVIAIGQMWTVIAAFLNETMSELKAKKKDEETLSFKKSDVTNP